MQTVIITGVSRGIGKATAQKFLDEGWFVIGTATNGKCDIQSPNFICLKLDYLENVNIDKCIAEIKKLDKKIDVLVNNAGIAEEETTPMVGIPILRRTLEVNLIGPAEFTGKLLFLFNSKAHVINISSNAASLTNFKGGAWIVPAYKISKTALNMFTRVTANQLKSRGITVSSLDPGWVKTDMGGEEAPRDPEDPAKEIFTLAISKIESGQFWRQGKERNW